MSEVLNVILGSMLVLCLVFAFFWRKKYKKIDAIFKYDNWDDYLTNPQSKMDLTKEQKELIDPILQKVSAKYSSEALNRQMKYSVLQSQINPHFLYNTLDSIRGEALMQENTSIAIMTERLSGFFRYCISTKGDFVTIRDEINNVLDYFYIQQYRFEDKFSLEIRSEESSYDFFVPKMILQPIIENSIYHGLERKKGKGNIKLIITETQKHLKIAVEDDGLGIKETQLKEINNNLRANVFQMKQDAMSEKSGIALYNVNNRIKLWYGDEYGVTVRSTIDMGTDVNMFLPKGTKENSEGRL
ncbi:histidine kinase [Lachnospiraceae bacterium ZAX-1]